MKLSALIRERDCYCDIKIDIPEFNLIKMGVFLALKVLNS